MVAAELPIEVEEFLSWLVAERGRSANTLSAYRRDLSAYCAWLTAHGTDPLEVGHGQLVEYVGERRASGAATSSVARQLAAIRMLHAYLALEGERRDDPAADLEGVRVPSGIPKPLSEAEVSSLLDAVEPNGTMRSLEPLPRSRTSRPSRSRSPIDRPTASDTRAPVA